MRWTQGDECLGFNGQIVSFTVLQVARVPGENLSSERSGDGSVAGGAWAWSRPPLEDENRRPRPSHRCGSTTHGCGLRCAASSPKIQTA